MKSFKQFISEAKKDAPLAALVIKKDNKLEIPFSVWKMEFDDRTRKIKSTVVPGTRRLTKQAVMKVAEQKAKKLGLNILDTKIFRDIVKRRMQKG